MKRYGVGDCTWSASRNDILFVIASGTECSATISSNVIAKRAARCGNLFNVKKKFNREAQRGDLEIASSATPPPQ